MTTAASSLPTDPAVLRPLLHKKLDEASPAELDAVNRLLLEMEARSLMAELDDATDDAWESGKITEIAIGEAIRAYRAEKPYR